MKSNKREQSIYKIIPHCKKVRWQKQIFLKRDKKPSVLFEWNNLGSYDSIKAECGTQNWMTSKQQSESNWKIMYDIKSIQAKYYKWPKKWI